MKTPLILAATALLLAACSGGGDENEATITNVEELTPTQQPVAAEPTPEPSPSPTETADPLPLEEPVEPDQQVLDDASATGMTARANRDGAQEEQPAEAAEEQ